eukprot:12047622-Alexandrium_andersonii.AAC.1
MTGPRQQRAQPTPPCQRCRPLRSCRSRTRRRPSRPIPRPKPLRRPSPTPENVRWDGLTVERTFRGEVWGPRHQPVAV